MFRRTHGRARRGVVGAIALVAALSATAITATTGGAAVGAQSSGGSSGKVDTNAVLKYGMDLTSNGGVVFDIGEYKIGNPRTRAWFEPLYDTYVRQTVDGKQVPALATKWSAPDPSTVEFTLRDGLKFNDGSAFTSAAVKTGWERYLATKSPFIPADMLAITAIETPDAQTVRVKLNQPIAQRFINNVLTNSQFSGVQSPASYAAGTANTKPVTAGPYMLKSYSPGGNIVYERNPNYWDKKAQKLAGLEFVNALDGSPQVSSLQAGASDMVANIPPDAYKTVESGQGLAVTARQGLQIMNITLCATKGLFASKEARQAVQYGIDRDAINTAVFDGLATPTNMVYPKGHPFYNAKLQKMYPHNAKKAKELLAQANIAPGTTVKAYTQAVPPNSVIAELVQGQLKDIGLNLQITTSANLSADLLRDQPDMGFVFLPDYTFLPFAVDRTTTSNYCGWRNAEASAQLAASTDGTKTAAEQKAASTRLQEILLEETPFIYEVFAPATAAHTNKVKGIGVVQQWGVDLRSPYKTK